MLITIYDQYYFSSQAIARFDGDLNHFDGVLDQTVS